MNSRFRKLRLPGIYIALLFVLIILMNNHCSRDREIIINEPTDEIQIPDKSEIIIRVYTGKSVAEMNLEKYIIGVVLAEMPADFAMEALKAQSVAARTFAWKRMLTGAKHSGYDICTNPSCCQGYLSEIEYLNRTDNFAAIQKVRTAVADTSGQILTYQQSPIEATFFSCSGGYTEAAESVWGTPVPYLSAKESPGEEDTVFFEDCKSFSYEELIEALNLPPDEIPVFADWSYTSGHGVQSVRICGLPFTGLQLRKLLGLRSTCFTVQDCGTSIEFHTRGYGHRVGMSQYGANALAQEGNTYDTILAFYYTDTVLSDISF